MTEEPEKKTCRRGHPTRKGKECSQCRQITREAYKQKYPEIWAKQEERKRQQCNEAKRRIYQATKSKTVIELEELDEIRARARLTASKALELLESRLPKPPPPKDLGLYQPTGMGYSVKRNYP